MSSIFISYRRAGTSGYGGRLQDDLRDRFGRDRVFRDIDSIRPGADFVEVISAAVASADIVLALIGRDWLSVTDESGTRRIDKEDDFVRIEIQSALDQGIVVIPVLVEGASMPSPDALPTPLAKLGRIQGIELSDVRWEYDVDRLAGWVRDVIGLEPLPPSSALDTGAHTLPVGLPAASPTPVDLTAPPQVTRPRGRRGPAGSGAGPARVGRNRAATGLVGLSVALLGAIALVISLAPTDSAGDMTIGQWIGAARFAAVTDPVAVPDVMSKSKDEAIASLTAAGFSVSFTEQMSDSIPAGTVITQEPASAAVVQRGTPVALTISSGNKPPATGPPMTVPGQTTVQPGSSVITSASTRTTATTTPTTAPTTVPPPPIATGELVLNGGAEDGPFSSPFTGGQAPSRWSRGALFPIAVAYGDSGTRSGCSQAGYGTRAQFGATSDHAFTGGFGGDGNCTIGGQTPALVQGISLAAYAGRTAGVVWRASGRLAAYPDYGDGAEMTVEILGSGGNVLERKSTGVVKNSSPGNLALQNRSFDGTLTAAAASVRITLSFSVNAGYSSGVIDDVSFRLG